MSTPSEQLQNPEFWTVAELATFMRLSKMTVYRLVSSNELESFRLGRSIRIPDRAVRTYLSNWPAPTTYSEVNHSG